MSTEDTMPKIFTQKTELVGFGEEFREGTL